MLKILARNNNNNRKKKLLIVIIKFIKDIGTWLEINIFKFKTMIENKISASERAHVKSMIIFRLYFELKKIITFERKNVETYKVAE